MAWTNEQITELLSKITPGKWFVTHWSGGFSSNGPPTVTNGTNPKTGEPNLIVRPKHEADAEFIAAAPEIVRQLLALVKKLENPKPWKPCAKCGKGIHFGSYTRDGKLYHPECVGGYRVKEKAKRAEEPNASS